MPVTTKHRAQAALLLAPPDALLSHVTALAAYGFSLPGEHSIHISTQDPWLTRVDGIRGHRRIYDISRRHHDGMSVTGPERTLVDLGTIVTLPWLISAADFLINAKLTTPEYLHEYAQKRHLDGVQKLRLAIRWVRVGAESPMETLCRLLIVFSGLPEPETQVKVFDSSGHFVARVDLAYRQWLVAIEYDGIWHERSASQRTRDRDRRERLELLGWTVVTLYETDLKTPESVPARIYEALKGRGFPRAAPRHTDLWARHIANGKIWAVSYRKTRV